MKDAENKTKKNRPPGIALTAESMDWLYNEKERRRKATGKTPSFAAIIDELIAVRRAKVNEVSGEMPSEIDYNNTNAPTGPAVLDALARIKKSIEVIEAKGCIDYERIEQTVMDGLRRLLETIWKDAVKSAKQEREQTYVPFSTEVHR